MTHSIPEIHPSAPLVRKLCKRLADERVAYCHFKSNDNLDRALSGATDLDLLVGREDAERFDQILEELGFKAAKNVLWSPPNVHHFYAHDPSAARLIHVHAHYQLVFGHDHSKGYRLPLEGPYLESSELRGVIRVPSPEFEYVLFVLRMVTKHSTWDSILRAEGRLSRRELDELDWLEEQVDLERVEEILAEHLPIVGSDLFRRGAAAIRPDTSVGTRIRTGRRLERALRPHASRPHYRDVYLKTTRWLANGLRRRFSGGAPKRQMKSGGAIIAVVGGDGSGKSTAIASLQEWLGSDVETKSFHLGKPGWSLTTYVVRGILKVGRTIGEVPRRLSRQGRASSGRAVRGYSRLIWHVLMARDRHGAYKRVRRAAERGTIVLTDRFPLDELRFMDGPQVMRSAGPRKDKTLVRALARIEESQYEVDVEPDVVLVLRVPPEIAVQRKTDEKPETVRARSQEVWDLDWDRPDVNVVDASRPASEVLATLKGYIWEAL